MERGYRAKQHFIEDACLAYEDIMTLYEFNQQGYTAAPKMRKIDYEHAHKELTQYLKDNYAKYYMLLNHDQKYITVFVCQDTHHNYESIAQEIIDIAHGLGALKDIEVNDHGAVEFWVTQGDTSHMYVLFNYDRGIVEI